MPNRQLLNSLPLQRIKTKRVLGLWLFSAKEKPKEITIREKNIASKLAPQRSKQYSLSRGFTRHVLSEMSGVAPLSIPLESFPGEPPQLPKGWGHISLSHCDDAFLIGWSPWQIGVDIERNDRNIAAEKIMKRFFSKEDQEEIYRTSSRELLTHAVLEQWLIKEAAIKWQKGKISLDLNKWKYDNNKKIVTHKNSGHQVNIHLISMNTWSLAVAYKKDKHKSRPIICISDLNQVNL